MQKVIYRGLVPLFFIGLLLSSRAFGQSTAKVSKNVNDFTPNPVEKPLSQHERDSITRVEDSIIRAFIRIIPLPENVRFFLDTRNSEAAKEAFAAFNDTLPADTDPFYIFFLEKEFVGKMAAYGAVGKEQKEYQKRNQKMLKFMRKTYGYMPEVVWYEIDDIKKNREYTPEDEIRIATHQIEADSTYLPAYRTRGVAYARLLRWEEACRDFSRLPDCIRRQIPEAHSCRE